MVLETPKLTISNDEHSFLSLQLFCFSQLAKMAEVFWLDMKTLVTSSTPANEGCTLLWKHWHWHL